MDLSPSCRIADDCDNDLVYLPEHFNENNFSSDNKTLPSCSLLAGTDNAASNAETSLGTWIFDKKSKKKKYISLSGKILHGKLAVVQSRHDKLLETRQSQIATRRELVSMVLQSQLHMDILLNSSASQQHHPNNSIVYDRSKLETWGIPLRIVNKYESRGLKQLFEWQIDCLCIQHGYALNGGNLVFSAPTSGGKTMVAELLILRRLGLRKGTVLFIAPYVALAEEKAEYFREMWADLGISVRVYHGDEGGSGDLTSDVDVAVCTIERANIILNQLLESGKEKQLTQVIVDELHMVADAHRGFLLEVTLSKIMHVMKNSVQCIGMSATLPNLADLARWLDAALYTTEYRPVQLALRLACHRQLYQCTAKNKQHNLTEQHVSTPQVEQQLLQSSKVFQINNIQPLQHKPRIQPTQRSSTSSRTPNMPNSKLKLSSEPNLHCDIHVNDIVNSRSRVISNRLTHSDADLEYHRDINAFDPRAVPLSMDPDGAVSLCLETVSEGKSVLLFCSSKEKCQTNALKVAECLKQLLSLNSNNCDNTKGTHNNRASYTASDSSNIPPHSFVASNVPTNFTRNVSLNFISSESPLSVARRVLLVTLSQSAVGLCPVLAVTVPYGVAYHHAGLTGEERRAVEGGFRQGALCVLCATSTLAAGVNLPAHRVIIRTPYMGNKDLTVAALRQMCGRAGRLGLDSSGEAVLVVNGTGGIGGGRHGELDLAVRLLIGDMEPLLSALAEGSGGGVEKLLLEMVCCGRLNHEREVLPFMQHTLMAVQHPLELLHQSTSQALTYLRASEFLLASSDGTLLPSQLGIPPYDAIPVIEALNTARQRFVIQTGFHSVFLVTPPHTSIIPPWTQLDSIVNALLSDHPGIEIVMTHLGLCRAQLQAYRFNPPPCGCCEPQTRLHKRFYSAVILYLLIHEQPLSRVSKQLCVERGQAQSLQKEAAVYCAMTVVFCRKLNWDLLAAALESLSGRLSLGVADDILPLARLGPELSSTRCRALLKSGVRTPTEVVQAGVAVVADILYSCVPFESKAPADVGGDVAKMAAFKTALLASCTAVAQKVVKRAKDNLLQEATLLHRSMTIDG